MDRNIYHKNIDPLVSDNKSEISFDSKKGSFSRSISGNESLNKNVSNNDDVEGPNTAYYSLLVETFEYKGVEKGQGVEKTTKEKHPQYLAQEILKLVIKAQAITDDEPRCKISLVILNKVPLESYMILNQGDFSKILAEEIIQNQQAYQALLKKSLHFEFYVNVTTTPKETKEIKENTICGHWTFCYRMPEQIFQVQKPVVAWTWRESSTTSSEKKSIFTQMKAMIVPKNTKESTKPQKEQQEIRISQEVENFLKHIMSEPEITPGPLVQIISFALLQTSKKEIDEAASSRVPTCYFFLSRAARKELLSNGKKGSKESLITFFEKEGGSKATVDIRKGFDASKLTICSKTREIVFFQSNKKNEVSNDNNFFIPHLVLEEIQ